MPKKTFENVTFIERITMKTALLVLHFDVQSPHLKYFLSVLTHPFICARLYN